MTKIDRVFYRAVFEENLEDPLSSRAEKGRFHDVGSGRTTYLAERPDTAWREVGARWQGDPDPAPYRMLVVRAKVRKVADLTDASVRRKYGVEASVLVGADWKPCQRLARRLREEGFEAIRTFSRADQPGGRQWVVFLDRLTPESGVRVVSVRGIAEAISPE